MGTPHKAWRQFWKMRNLVKHVVLTQRNQREAAVSKAWYPGMHSGSVQLEKPRWNKSKQQEAKQPGLDLQYRADEGKK